MWIWLCSQIMWVKLHGMHKDVRIPELPLLLGSFILTYKLVPCGPLLGGWDCRYFIAFAFCKFHLSLSLFLSCFLFFSSSSFVIQPILHLVSSSSSSGSDTDVSFIVCFLLFILFFLILCPATNMDNLDLMGVIWVGVLDAGERYWTRWHQGSL